MYMVSSLALIIKYKVRSLYKIDVFDLAYNIIKLWCSINLIYNLNLK